MTVRDGTPGVEAFDSDGRHVATHPSRFWGHKDRGRFSATLPLSSGRLLVWPEKDLLLTSLDGRHQRKVALKDAIQWAFELTSGSFVTISDKLACLWSSEGIKLDELPAPIGSKYDWVHRELTDGRILLRADTVIFWNIVRGEHQFVHFPGSVYVDEIAENVYVCWGGIDVAIVDGAGSILEQFRSASRLRDPRIDRYRRADFNVPTPAVERMITGAFAGLRANRNERTLTIDALDTSNGERSSRWESARNISDPIVVPTPNRIAFTAGEELHVLIALKAFRAP
ncbi:MAG: hypothetical protein ABWY12_18565 [Burkholderiales bacterium]